MEREKQIDELTKIIRNSCENEHNCKSCKYNNLPLTECLNVYRANTIIEKGYRKVDTGVTIHMNGESELTKAFNEAFALAPQLGWISVEDRLPETDYKNTFDYNVLVYIPKREGCKQSGMFLGKVCKVEGDDGKRNFWNIKTEPCEWTVWGWSYFEHPVVTHWMPLPQPPKMKGAE